MPEKILFYSNRTFGS